MIQVFAGLWGTVLCGLLFFVPLTASAANNVDKAALKKATAECRAQVKVYARYNETSWHGRHKRVKKCIAAQITYVGSAINSPLAAQILVHHAVDFGAVLGPLLDLVEVAIVRQERVIFLLVGAVVHFAHLMPKPALYENGAATSELPGQATSGLPPAQHPRCRGCSNNPADAPIPQTALA
jgi:hypothetical protein